MEQPKSMPNEYDFTNLDPNEFETLANDLLSKEFCQRIERFKPGKDSGIDGRFFPTPDSCCIIQAKHYAGSTIAKLISSLKNDELPKIKKLNPDRYIVASSLPLSPENKDDITLALSPYVQSTADIFGGNDLNALIRKYPEIEKQYNKLWIQSSTVLLHLLNAGIHNASQALISQARENNDHYAVTASHAEAREKIDKTHVLVVTGEPGVGKTTLAEQLCLEFVADGYELIVISDDIKEGGDVWLPDTKQIFYFDDFLGKNCLETLQGNEDTKIMRFIERIVKSTNKKFILTSRANILDQGYRVSQQLNSSKLKAKEYIINVTNYNDKDKANILYKFLWKSDLDKDYLEKIINDKQYFKIIKHQNYNPRLIEFITSNVDCENIKPNDYISYINATLNNPQEIWKHPYTIQLNDFSRAIVDLVAFSKGELFSLRYGIGEGSLRAAYSKFLKDGNPTATSNISQDFDSVVKVLLRSFIKKTIYSKKEEGKYEVYYNLFNPSIGDFIWGRYANNYDGIASRLLLWEGEEGLQFLERFKFARKILVQNVAESITKQLEISIHKKDFLYKIRLGSFLDNKTFAKYFVTYDLKELIVEMANIEQIQYVVITFINKIIACHNYSPQELSDYCRVLLTYSFSYSAIIELSETLQSIDFPEADHAEIEEKYHGRLLECWGKEIRGFASTHIESYTKRNECNNNGDDCKYSIDEDKLAELIHEDTKELFTPIDKNDAKKLFQNLDLTAMAVEHYNSGDDDDRERGGYTSGENAGNDDAESIFEGLIASKFG